MAKLASLPVRPTQVGPYVIEDLLGRGTHAVVYRGVHEALARPSAVKVLAPAIAADADFVQRFHHEAHLAARLVHQNIVTVFDTGVTDGLHWLGMELVDGTVVEDLVRAHGKFDVGSSLRIVRDVAKALHHGASRGILHRDVKASNVLLCRVTGESKLADFGLATEVQPRGTRNDDGSEIGIGLGTPKYVSPESALGRPDVDVRSDIYSLGILLFELLTGVVPLRGNNKGETVLRHLRENVPLPGTLVPSLLPDIDAVVAHMTARPPKYRYPDAVALVADLELLISGQPPRRALAIAKEMARRKSARMQAPGRRRATDR